MADTAANNAAIELLLIDGQATGMKAALGSPTPWLLSEGPRPPASMLWSEYYNVSPHNCSSTNAQQHSYTLRTCM